MINKIIDFSQQFHNKEEIILRDYLSLERTKLANERTLLSYIRTSLYLFLGGIAFLQIQGFNNIYWLGYLSIFFSLLFLVIGIFRFIQLKKRLKIYYAEFMSEIKDNPTD